jgi:hypothetical protein
MTASRAAAIAVLPLLLAGCGSSAPKLPSLGMFGGSSEEAAPATTASVAPKPVTPEERATQVGATSARAQKCGYNFDPAKLKANYLASEMQAGTPAAQMAKVDKVYDLMFLQVRAAIAGEAGYCNDAKTKEIKADLTRHLAGDYSPPQQKVAESGGLFDTKGPTSNKPLTADDMWDKSGMQRPRAASQR